MKSMFRPVGIRIYVAVRRALYRLRQLIGLPVTFRINDSLAIRLHPEGQIAELLYTSRFERRDLQLVAGYLTRGMNVIDIGANIGLYSILADRLVSPGGRVFAFEPSAESTARLHANMALNRGSEATTSIETLKIALSDRIDGELNLTREAGRGDGERFLDDGRASGGSADDAELVPVTSLDHHFYNSGEKAPRIDFLKIDIEGGELPVFRGASRLLRENEDLVIMFESTEQNCRRYGYEQRDVFTCLEKAGYKLYCWNRDRRGWDSEPERLLVAGNLWACRDPRRLPYTG